MDAGAAINSAESDLRALIHEILGDGWLAKSRGDLSRLEARRDEERKRRPGAVVDDDLLAYTEFYELKEIIIDNWAEFADVWRSKKYFEAIFSRIEDFRNPDAHSRVLLPFEEHLVLGLSGEIRNTITMHRSTRAVSGEYYPVIEMIEDSLGNRLVPTAAQQTGGGLKLPTPVGVGDRLHFRARAWDPQGRQLEWEVRFVGKDPPTTVHLVGAEVEFGWEVSENEVAENLPLIGISMWSDGKYHRNRTKDSSLAVYVTVLPPDV